MVSAANSSHITSTTNKKQQKSVSVQTFALDSDLTLLLPFNHNQSGVVYEIRKMEPRGSSRIRSIAFLCLFLAVAGIIGFGYFCDSKVCALSKREVILNSPEIMSHDDDFMINDNFNSNTNNNHKTAAMLVANPGLSYDEVLNDDFQFDMNAHDVMVFLHIQKTGGTSFGKHLVRDLDLKVRLVFFLITFELN
uniref:Heparan-sulfate 6-O-sulfotransferase n=1 Tax=Culicoides sonorensis TaxID=179676 RepID=A0A336L752_CULSO